jgi:hypothetical protein
LSPPALLSEGLHERTGLSYPLFVVALRPFITSKLIPGDCSLVQFALSLT